jgi:hypothetical protein
LLVGRTRSGLSGQLSGSSSQPGSGGRPVTGSDGRGVAVRGRPALRVQAVRTRRRWLAGLRKEYAMRASSFASRLRLSDLAFVTPVSTAAAISFSHLDTVLARVSSSGMSSFCADQS